MTDYFHVLYLDYLCFLIMSYHTNRYLNLSFIANLRVWAIYKV